MATVNEPEPACHCKEAGQPMTWIGVRHLPDCEWVFWFMGSSLWTGTTRGELPDGEGFRG